LKGNEIYLKKTEKRGENEGFFRAKRGGAKGAEKMGELKLGRG